MAGAHYGVGGIPAQWLKKLWKENLIQAMADDLLRVAGGNINR